MHSEAETGKDEQESLEVNAEEVITEEKIEPDSEPTEQSIPETPEPADIKADNDERQKVIGTSTDSGGEATAEPAAVPTPDRAAVTASDAPPNEAASSNPEPQPVQPTVITGKNKTKWSLLRFRPEYIFPRRIRMKLGKSARLLGLLIIVLILGGGAASAYYLVNNRSHKSSAPPKVVFAAKVAPFAITSTDPADNAMNVPVSSKVTLTFNRPVDPASVKNDFFTSPTIPGSFTQGATKDQVVFTPDAELAQGAIVKVMIHGELQSLEGSKLGSDYSLSYETVIPADGVEFNNTDSYINTKMDTAQSHTTRHFTMQVGPDVKPGGQITIYKGDVQSLLKSLVYTGSDSSFSGSGQSNVSTGSFTKVITINDLKDGQKIEVNEGTGLYFVAATSGGKQLGWTWVVFNQAGLLVRQDPKNVIVAVQNLDNTPLASPADVTLYNLKDDVNVLKSGSVSDDKAFPTDYQDSTDLVVATSGDNTMVAPLAVPLSLADIRGNNSYDHTFYYGLTDRPVYQQNDTIKFAAYVRSDNDAQYALPKDHTERLFVAKSQYDDNHLKDFTVDVGSGGVINGSIPVDASFVPTDQENQQLGLYGYVNGPSSTATPISSFVVSRSKKPQYTFSVNFAKKEYLANNTVSATITGKNADGTPLMNTDVTYNIYAKTYYERDDSANLGAIGTNGSQIGNKDATVKLDGSGQATLPIDLSKLPSGNSQVVTVVVNKQDANNIYASAGGSAIVHMGDAVIRFGVGKASFQKGQNLVGQVYVTKLDGTPLINNPVSYRFAVGNYDDASQQVIYTTLASGSTQTDSNGYVEINQAVKTGDNTSITLLVETSDENNLKVSAQSYLYVNSGDTPVIQSDLTMANLDMHGSNGETTVGQTLNLTINAPADVTVLVAQQRGIIYKYSKLDLKKGNNVYSVDVTQQLAPSFTLSFSYFQQGRYYNEGASFDVNTPAKQATVTVTPDKQAYTAGSTAGVQIQTSSNASSPLLSNVILGVVDDSIYSLNDLVAPDIFTTFYQHREITTNSSSSLTDIGTGGGGKCGGSGDDELNLINGTGTTLFWKPDLQTGADGKASVSFKVPKGKWRIYTFSADSGAIVGSSTATISAQ